MTQLASVGWQSKHDIKAKRVQSGSEQYKCAGQLQRIRTVVCYLMLNLDLYLAISMLRALSCAESVKLMNTVPLGQHSVVSPRLRLKECLQAHWIGTKALPGYTAINN